MARALPVYSADAPIIQVSAQNIYLAAGQENNIKIVLSNSGDYKVFDVEAFLSSATPGLTVLSNANKVFTEIAADKSRSYEATIYVDQSINLGAYSLSLTVTYGRTGATLTQIINVPIGVVVSEAFKPNIVYTGSDSLDVSAGINSVIEYSFRNSAESTLSNIEFILTSPNSQMTILRDEITRIQSIAPGEEFSITPEIAILQGTELTTYTLTATVSYSEEETRYHQSFNLPIHIDSEKPSRSTIVTLKEINTDGVIYPGEEFKVSLVVECTGADAFDLMSVLGGDLSGSLSPLSPTTIMIGDISAGEIVSFSYNLLAKGNIPAGQYPISVTIAYINSKGAPASLSETVTVQVEGLIDFQLLDIPSLETPRGQVTELEADLLLIGTESVEFVSIEAIEDDAVSLVSGSEEYIGAVDPDSPIPFDLSFKIDPEAEKGTHDLGLRINYRDHLNKEHSDVIQVSIDIIDPVPETSGNQGQGFFSWLLSVLGLRN